MYTKSYTLTIPTTSSLKSIYLRNKNSGGPQNITFFRYWTPMFVYALILIPKAENKNREKTYKENNWEKTETEQQYEF